MENAKKKNVKRKESKNYRLVIQEEKTYEEKFSLKLSRSNVFLIGTFISLIIISITTVIIFFTPVREYIPGYDTTKMRVQAINNLEKLDSLINQLSTNDNYLESVFKTINGEEYKNIYANESQRISVDLSQLDMSLKAEDSILRKYVENEDKFNLTKNELVIENKMFYSPIKGDITQSFNYEENHFAVDISADVGTPVKSILDGKILFSEWSVDTGHVIIIDHGDNIISVYKHNSKLLKEQNDYVQAGEVIAYSGNQGNLSSGPHLHFELWNNGTPIDPEPLLNFQ